MRACRAAGWRFALPHFRGCSGELNRRPRGYHSGDSGEIDWILRRLLAADGGRPLCAAGVSLGGNALLKWAGERGPAAAEAVTGVAAICAPLDLAACGHHLARGFNRVYTRHFLATMKARSAARLRCFPGLFDEARMLRAANLYEFDDAVTAPLHGFAGTDDYWRRCSAKPWLAAIGRAGARGQPEKRPVFAGRLPAGRRRRRCGGPPRTPGRGRSCRLRQRRLSGQPRLAAATAPPLLPSRNVIGDHHEPTPAEIFKAYDIRGIVGKSLTAGVVRRIGHALGSLAAEQGQTAIAVGRDGRLSGPELAGALIDGICAAGCDAIDIGCVPTPVTYFAAHHLGCDSCVSVTGSHNPPDYNGLKMVIGGTTLALDAIQQIKARAERGDLRHGRAGGATPTSRAPTSSASFPASVSPAR
jgi:hypothetical protein